MYGKKGNRGQRQQSRVNLPTVADLRRPDENPLLFVRRVSDNGILVDPRTLYQLLVTGSNDVLKEGLTRQYHVATEVPRGTGKYWIREARVNARCDLSDSWIDENMPAMDGSRFKRSKRESAPYDYQPCRDIRLSIDPTLPVLQTDVVCAGDAQSAERGVDSSKTDGSFVCASDASSSSLQERCTVPSSTATSEPAVTPVSVVSAPAPGSSENVPASTVSEPFFKTMVFTRKRSIADRSSKATSVVRPPLRNVTFVQPADEVKESGLKITMKNEDVTPAKKSKVMPEHSCLLSSCSSRDSRERRHAMARHLPPMFTEIAGNLQVKINALRWLVSHSVGKDNFSEAIRIVNASGVIPATCELTRSHRTAFREVCQMMNIKAPKTLTLHPVNSPAALLFWRCMMVLLSHCTKEQQESFRYMFRPLEDTSAAPVVSPKNIPVTSTYVPSVISPKNIPVTSTYVPSVVVNSASGSSALEIPSQPLTNIDLSTITDSEVCSIEIVEEQCLVPVATAEVPLAFDSHFHLDRTSLRIWGKPYGHTVEDLIVHSTSSKVKRIPSCNVTLAGGIIVYSEPKTYPHPDFSIQGPWKVAVGVHPKHYEMLTTENYQRLQRLLLHPKVVALGECGLDRTVSIGQRSVSDVWMAQEEVFCKLLKLAVPEKPIVLHLRGVTGDVYGRDVHCSCLLMMESICSRQQKVQVHCFTGRAELVKLWLWKFPNTYFSVNAGVQRFNSEQIAGLQAIPLEHLLLETDSPYFPLGDARVNTPAYVGEVASFVGTHRDLSTREVLRVTTNNALRFFC